MKSTLNIHWKDWCWSCSSNTLATGWGELTHLKGPWCWERLKAGGEGDDRRWDDWMASLTQWTWVWVDSSDGQGGLVCCGSWGRTVGHDWATELNWTLLIDTGTEILNKIIANWIWQYIKRIIHTWGLSQGCKDFSTFANPSVWYTTSINWRS